LYGDIYLGIPFDHWIHFVAGIFLGLFFYDYFSKIIKNKATVLLLSILVSAGIGSLLEIVEFVGYSYLGKGEGILFYGSGDWGEWNNMSLDLIFNTTGALAGGLIIFIKRLLRKKIT